MTEPKIPAGAPPGPNAQKPILPWDPSRGVTPAGATSNGAAPGLGLTEGGSHGVHALQQVKGRVHRRLLERLNLSNLDRLERQQVAEAVRKVVHDLITHESVPLNFEERDAVVIQVL